MFDPLQPGPERRAGQLHSFTLAHGLRAEPDAAVLHNGMAWSADGSGFYLAHSYERTIFRFDFDPQSGRLGERRVFARVGAHDGIPDGAAVDAEGGYWSALHGAGRLRRFHPDGEVDHDVAVPALAAHHGGLRRARPSTCSTSQALRRRRRPADDPRAGELFRARPGVRGLARNIYLN